MQQHEFICDGTRDSKWYYDGQKYIRVFDRRSGETTKYYSHGDIMKFPLTNDIAMALHKHVKKCIDSKIDVV